LEVGLARVCVTPPMGTKLIGQPEQLEADGKYTDLFARAFYLESVGNRLLVISCDLLFLPKDVTDYLRKAVSAETSIPFKNILIHTTHTHAGPAVTGLFGENNIDQRVSKEIYKGIISSATAAYRSRQRGFIGLGRSYRYDLAFNRRYVMKDGSVELHPHKDDPNISEPEGPSDPEVNVIIVYDEKKVPSGIVANFSCHLTSLERSNTKFSADFPAFAEKELVKHFKNDDFILLYVNGPCGNVCQVNVEDKSVKEVGIHHTQKMGRMFAESLLNAMEDAELQPEEVELKIVYREIKIPIREITEEMLIDARKVVDSFAGKKLHVWNLSDYGTESYTDKSVISANKLLETDFWKNAAAIELLKLGERYADNRFETVPLTLARIGKSVIAAIPAELFVEFSLEIKEQFKKRFEYVFVFELVNGWVGYVPTKKAFEPEIGGYEIQFLNSSKLCEDAGEIMVHELFEMGESV